MAKRIGEDAAFHEGDVVTVYNQRYDGRPIIEGRAVITGPGEAHDQYRVRFRGGADGRTTYLRFVFPGECQTDPAGYLSAAQADFDRRRVVVE